MKHPREGSDMDHYCLFAQETSPDGSQSPPPSNTAPLVNRSALDGADIKPSTEQQAMAISRSTSGGQGPSCAQDSSAMTCAERQAADLATSEHPQTNSVQRVDPKPHNTAPAAAVTNHVIASSTKAPPLKTLAISISAAGVCLRGGQTGLLGRARTSQSAPAALGPSPLGSPRGGLTHLEKGASSDGEADAVNSDSMPPPPPRPARFSGGSIPAVPPTASGGAPAPSRKFGEALPALQGRVGPGKVHAALMSRPQNVKGDLRKEVMLRNGIAERAAKGPTVTEVGCSNTGSSTPNAWLGVQLASDYEAGRPVWQACCRD